MTILAYDKKLDKILKDPNKIIKKIGLDMAIILKKRLNQLDASNNFQEFLNIGLGKPHPLKGNMKNMYGISITKNYRLVVEPICDSIDVSSLMKCEKINIKGVGDYHDGKCEWIIP